MDVVDTEVCTYVGPSQNVCGKLDEAMCASSRAFDGTVKDDGGTLDPLLSRWVSTDDAKDHWIIVVGKPHMHTPVEHPHSHF